MRTAWRRARAVFLLAAAAVSVPGAVPWIGGARAEAESYTIRITDRGFRPGKIYGRLDHPIHIAVYNVGEKTHNLVIPAFYIFTANLPSKGSTTVEFTPDKRGSYPFYSDTGGAVEAGLTGEVVVR